MTTNLNHPQSPSICLSTIVRNESHIICEMLDSVAPFIQTWVIVDTGSTDGTQDVIKRHMAELGIPGELHERPWKNFGYNRSEALALAQGHADYIWVMDADDIVVGVPDFASLTADEVAIRIGSSGLSYWREQMFRDGVPFYYHGVVHEYARCDSPHTIQRLAGDYFIDSRRLGSRSLDPEKYNRDIELLTAEVERNPDDSRSVFYLARSYNSLYDWPNARRWYARRAEMGGWDEEVFYSLWRVATATQMLGAPVAEVQAAYLKAWASRPSRAEPLYDLACYFRRMEMYQRGHLYAEHAAAIPQSDADSLFIEADVYRFRSLDEQAVCASWIGRTDEAVALWLHVLALEDIPEDDRARIVANLDVVAPGWRAADVGELLSWAD